jgi:hypothetical protein
LEQVTVDVPAPVTVLPVMVGSMKPWMHVA